MKPFRLWLYRLCSFWLQETRCFWFKAAMLRWCGATIGRDVRIVSGVEIVGTGKLIVGDDVFVGARSRIVVSDVAIVEIGSCVDIGPGVMILTGTHDVALSGTHVAGAGRSDSVKIGNGCWLCARATILPGVELAPRTLVAAGAVVTRSVAIPGKKIAGVPAQEFA